MGEKKNGKKKPSTMDDNTTTKKMTSSASNHKNPSPFSSSFRFIRFDDRPNDSPIPANHFELDECDVFWPAESLDERSAAGDGRRRPGFPPGKFGLSAALAEDGGVPVPKRRPAGVGKMLQQSAPVNVPWPRGMRKPAGALLEEDEREEEDKAEDEMVPPHLIAARSRAMTSSVVEGVGRTLKGRDLRRVRNAVFRKTGFLE